VTLIERAGSIHIHTDYSDGAGTHAEVAEAAAGAGLDFVVVTDHNVLAREHEGWRSRVLVLVGEEVHDPAAPDVNHLLVLGAERDLAPLAGDPQALLRAAQAHGGLAFIAHPHERAGRAIAEGAIDWVAWDAEGYTGLEIWNYMSEFKGLLSSRLAAVALAYAPRLGIRGPFPETLARWDALLARGGVVYALGGADAHAQEYALGPLRRRVFDYPHLFRAVTTHVLVSGEWTGRLDHDARLVYEALAAGRAFVAYDALADARGFRFTAEDEVEERPMGATVPAWHGLALRIEAPRDAYLRLVRHGEVVAEGEGCCLVFPNPFPGAYRAEAYLHHALRRRGWIFSNPIFVRSVACPGPERPPADGSPFC
jgi:hypothetical protein